MTRPSAPLEPNAFRLFREPIAAVIVGFSCGPQRVDEMEFALKRIAVMTAAALIGAGTLATTGAEARGRGGAIAAGVVGGLAVGALAAGAANSGYGYGYGRPAYGYDDGYRGGYRGAGYGGYEDRGYYRRPGYGGYDYGY